MFTGNTQNSYTNYTNLTYNTVQIRKKTRPRKRKALSRPTTKAQPNSSKKSKATGSNSEETKGPGKSYSIVATETNTQTATNPKSSNTVPALTQASVTPTIEVAASTLTGVDKNVALITEMINKNCVSHNIPSLFSCNLSRINSDVSIKTEPAAAEDAMIDDLADCL